MEHFFQKLNTVSKVRTIAYTDIELQVSRIERRIVHDDTICE